MYFNRSVIEYHNNSRQIACVTGATGMIGSRIVRKLITAKYRVRVLTNKVVFNGSDVESFSGRLENEKLLASFLEGAHLLFHCAAELQDERKMWEVNVLGTKRLLRLAKESGIRYFCHLSSVGVIGLTDRLLVDEETPCSPQNTYEDSKLAAEKELLNETQGFCSIVILRPTDVIDERRPGVLLLPMTNTFRDKLKVFVKGGERAHIIHAEDVADAAMYFINVFFKSTEIFIVSCDQDQRNTYAGLWALYKKYVKRYEKQRQVYHLPVIVPHFIRTLRRGKSNRGDIIYSSKKLLSKGFNFNFGVDGAVRSIIESNHLK